MHAESLVINGSHEPSPRGGVWGRLRGSLLQPGLVARAAVSLVSESRLPSVAALLLPVLLLVGCQQGGGEPPEAPPTQVEIGAVATASIDETIAAVGTIEANEIVELKTESPGRITAIHFTEGKRVAAGDKLFELDAEKEAAQLAQARAEEEIAAQNLERAKRLAGTKAISQQELDTLASQVAARAAARRLHEERVRDMTITAPFAGVVGPRRVSVGQYVDSGQSLVTLVDSARVKVSFRIPEREAARFKLGQVVRVRTSAYPEQVFEGEVDLLSPVHDEATRTAPVRALVPNPDGRLKPGMFARVETVVARRAAALVIPESAVVPGLEVFSAYTVSNGVARLSPIQLGVRGRGSVEILAGLSAGDPIVVQGTQKLVDGSRVIAGAPPPVAMTNGAATASTTVSP